MKKLIAALSLVFLLPLMSCKDFDDVDTRSYETIPTEILSNPIESQASFIKLLFYPIIQGPSHTLDNEGDYLIYAISKNSFSGRKFEPRRGVNNSTLFGSIDHKLLFEVWHKVTLGSTSLLRAIREGKIKFKDDDERHRTIALCYFTRAMAYGYLSKTFDSALLIDGETEVNWDNPTLSHYKEILGASLANFDTLFNYCNTHNFEIPLSLLPTNGAPYSNKQLLRLAHTYAANFILQLARSFEENQKTDWEKVLSLSKNGLMSNEDFFITVDGKNWNHSLQESSTNEWLGIQADYRIIRWIDPSYPKRFPRNTSRLYLPSDSLDKRLYQYFYRAFSVSYPFAIGGLNTELHFNRYKSYYSNITPVKPAVFLYAETNRLIEAEALAMTGNLSAAIAMINDPNSRRKTIGKVADIPSTSTLDEVLNQIHKERDLELMLTDYALHYADARRFGRLQRGAILHFPVPFTELTNRRLSIYTYGGQTPASIKEQSGTQLDTSRSWLRPSEIR